MMSFLRGLCIGLLGLSCAQAQAHTTHTTVLSAHPIVSSIAQTLVQDTPIEIRRIAPESLPPTRWNTYFAGRGASALARDAARADAVLTLRSLWPDDPLYALTRRANIRIVEIDAARPVDGALPGMALQAASSKTTAPLIGQAWLDPSNLGRMADIIATDLQRLAPDASDALARRLATFKQSLVTLSAQTESALAQAPNLSVIVLSDRLDYLVSALNLDAVRFKQLGMQWDDAAIDALSKAVRDNDVAAVLHHEPLPEAVQRAIAAAKSDCVSLTLAPVATSDEVETTFKRVVQALSRA